MVETNTEAEGVVVKRSMKGSERRNMRQYVKKWDWTQRRIGGVGDRRSRRRDGWM